VRTLTKVMPAGRVFRFSVLNKTALVTRSTAGIGLTIATTLAKEGAAVIVNGRTRQRVDEALRTNDAAYGQSPDRECREGFVSVLLARHEPRRAVLDVRHGAKAVW
jgi:short-subunit dehydrogenase involved in D-alanine esterification of teichoic acids